MSKLAAASSKLGEHGVLVSPVSDDVAENDTTVFISYSRKDMAFVDRLDADLRARGIGTLVDRADIEAGERWRARLEDLITRADTVIFVLSPDSVASPICAEEIVFGKRLGKRFMPVVARQVATPSVPQTLSELNYVFLDVQATYGTQLDRLVRAIHTDLGWVRMHADFGRSALEWNQAGQPRGLLLGRTKLKAAEAWLANRPANAPLATLETRAFITASRRAARQWRDGAIGVLVLAIVSTSGLATYAWRQKEIAETSLENARIAAEGLIVDLGQDLRGRGLSTAALSNILSRAEKLMDQIVLYSPRNILIKRSQAKMYGVFAENFAIVGDRQKYRIYAERSLTISQSIYDANKDDWRSRWALSSGLNVVAGTYFSSGENEAAFDLYQRSSKVSYGREDENFRALREQAVALSGMAESLVFQGKLQEAIPLFNQSLVVVNKSIDKSGNLSPMVKTKAIILYNFANMYYKNNELESARQLLNDSGYLIGQLAKKEPENAEFTTDLVQIMVRLGKVLKSMGNTDGIDHIYDDLVPTLKKIHGSDVLNADITKQLIELLRLVAENKNGADLISVQEEIVALRTKLYKADARNPSRIVSLVYSLDELGTALTQNRLYNQAINTYERIQSYNNEILRINVNNEKTARLMAVAMYKLGSLHLAVGNREKGCAFLVQSLESIQEFDRINQNKLRELADIVSSNANFRQNCNA